MLTIGAFGKAISGVFLLNVVEVFAGFIIAIFLTNLAGDEVFGAYSYALSLSTLIVVFCIFGHDQFLVRCVASSTSQEENIGFLMVKSLAVSLTTVTVICGLLLIVVNSLHENGSVRKSALMAMPVLAYVVVISRYFEAYTQGVGKVFESSFSSKIIRPFCLIIILAMLYVVFGFLSVEMIIFSSSVAVIPGIIYLFRRSGFVNSFNAQQLSASVSCREFISRGSPFVLIAGVTVLNENIDMVVLAQFVSDSELAVYRISSRVSSVASFAIVAINAVFAPKIAALYSTSELERMERLAVRASKWAFFISLSIGFLIFILSQRILSVFGEAFVFGDQALNILLIGKVLGSAIGSVGLILAMTRFESVVGKNLIFCCVINVVLNYLLVPWLGIEGAALSSSLIYVLLPLINLWFVNRLLGINAFAFSGVFIKGKIDDRQ